MGFTYVGPGGGVRIVMSRSSVFGIAPASSLKFRVVLGGTVYMVWNELELLLFCQEFERLRELLSAVS